MMIIENEDGTTVSIRGGAVYINGMPEEEYRKMAEAEKAKEPKKKTVYVCEACGSEDVEHAMWVNVNTKEVFEDFGSWCNGDNSYCNSCDEHTELVEKKT